MLQYLSIFKTLSTTRATTHETTLFRLPITYIHHNTRPHFFISSHTSIISLLQHVNLGNNTTNTHDHRLMAVPRKADGNLKPFVLSFPLYSGTKWCLHAAKKATNENVGQRGTLLASLVMQSKPDRKGVSLMEECRKKYAIQASIDDNPQPSNNPNFLLVFRDEKGKIMKGGVVPICPHGTSTKDLIEDKGGWLSVRWGNSVQTSVLSLQGVGYWCGNSKTSAQNLSQEHGKWCDCETKPLVRVRKPKGGSVGGRQESYTSILLSHIFRDHVEEVKKSNAATALQEFNKQLSHAGNFGVVIERVTEVKRSSLLGFRCRPVEEGWDATVSPRLSKHRQADPKPKPQTPIMPTLIMRRVERKGGEAMAEWDENSCGDDVRVRHDERVEVDLTSQTSSLNGSCCSSYKESEGSHDGERLVRRPNNSNPNKPKRGRHEEVSEELAGEPSFDVLVRSMLRVADAAERLGNGVADAAERLGNDVRQQCEEVAESAREMNRLAASVRPRLERRGGAPRQKKGGTRQLHVVSVANEDDDEDAVVETPKRRRKSVSLCRLNQVDDDYDDDDDDDDVVLTTPNRRDVGNPNRGDFLDSARSVLPKNGARGGLSTGGGVSKDGWRIGSPFTSSEDEIESDGVGW